MTTMLNNVASTISDVVQGLPQIGGHGSACTANDSRRSCYRESTRVVHDNDFNNDGHTDRTKIISYKNSRFESAAYVEFLGSKGEMICGTNVSQGLRLGYRADDEFACTEIVWRKQPSDEGVRIGDVIDLYGEPWKFEGVAIDVRAGSTADMQSTDYRPLPAGPIAAALVTLYGKSPVNGPGSSVAGVRLTQVETLQPYQGDIAQEMRAVLECQEHPSDASCQQAAQASRTAHQLVDRYLRFERMHYESLVILAEYGARQVALRQFDETPVNERTTTDYRLAAQLREDLDQLPQGEALFWHQSCMAQLGELFDSRSRLPAREVVSEWLGERFGLGKKERAAAFWDARQ